MSSTLDNTIVLTDRLLQLSRLTRMDKAAGQTLEPVNLVNVAQTSCFSRLSQARSKHIDLGYEGLSTACVMGEPVLLAEMCANLLDNALKYTPEGGIVTIKVSSDVAQQAVLLEVEDSGPGIDTDQVRFALLPFHRLDNAAEQSGAGLGLALVNDIARLHSTRPDLLRSPTSGGLLVRIKLLAI